MTTMTKEEVTIRKGNGSAVAEAAEVVERAMTAPEEVPEIEVPKALEKKADKIVDAYVDFLVERTQEFAQEQVVEDVEPEAGSPIVAGLQYWNVFTRGPYQLQGPYSDPSRVIAAGKLGMMIGIVWLNPRYPSPWVFSGKQCRVAFETINLSDVTSGPERVWYRTFPDAAHFTPIHVFRWYFRLPDPGPSPNLYETTLTADLTMAGLPFAAFSSWHHDPQGHMGIPGLTPNIPWPHWHHDVPARFMVYRE